MRRFIKTAVISEAKTPLKLTKLDPADSSIHTSHSKIDLGFTADKSTVSEKRVLQFQMEYKEFLVRVVFKLIAKAPIQYSLVRNINCLDPRNMMSGHDVSITKFKRVLTTLENAKKVLEGDCDRFWNYLDNLLWKSPLLLPQSSETMILTMTDLSPFCIFTWDRSVPTMQSYIFTYIHIYWLVPTGLFRVNWIKHNG